MSFVKIKNKSLENMDSLLKDGPLIDVVVSAINSPQVIGTKQKHIKGLIDTGASDCIIDEALAKELNLSFLGQEEVSTPNGISHQSIYKVSLFVPETKFQYQGRLIEGNLREHDQVHEVLLGRDFLSTVIMIYNGKGGKYKLKK